LNKQTFIKPVEEKHFVGEKYQLVIGHGNSDVCSFGFYQLHTKLPTKLVCLCTQISIYREILLLKYLNFTFRYLFA